MQNICSGKLKEKTDAGSRENPYVLHKAGLLPKTLETQLL